MNSNLNKSTNETNFVSTAKAELRVMLHFAYLAKKVFLFMF